MVVASRSVAVPATLDHEGIARHVPHSGRMCLLGQMLACSAEAIHCTASSHHDADNPLLSASGELLAPCAIEYAAQAMALHGALLAGEAGPPRGGYIAAVRKVRFEVPSLHAIEGDLQIHAKRLAGAAGVVSYQFHLDSAAGLRLADGRATVVLEPAELLR